MKTTLKIATNILMVLGLVMTSCEKSETETELPFQEGLEEGFISKTGNNDSEIDETSAVLLPLLHKQYDASLSREEAEASFDIEVSKFMKEEGKTKRSEAYFYFQVATLTGTHTNSQTDALVYTWVHFLTSNGDHWVPAFELNKVGRNDRENGAYDFFYYGSSIPRTDWIEVENATLFLQGTDGWYVKWFDIHLHNDSRYSSATGSAHIYSDPETWLDNSTSSGWDIYNTGDIGTGRINF